MKVFKYILREFKNLFEFYLIPLLAVILPHKIYYPFYKFICSYTFFYNLYTRNIPIDLIGSIKGIKPSEHWNRNIKLLHLVDITDCWLSLLRPKKALKLQNKIGEWNCENGFLALSAHWGPGFNSLLDLKTSEYKPFFVFSEVPVSFVDQGFLERYYRKIRRFFVDKISGSNAIATGKGGYDAIKNNVENLGVPVILCDAPREQVSSKYSLNLFDYKYPIASGFLNLICFEKIPFRLFSERLNFETGLKELRIVEQIKVFNESDLIELLSTYLENLIIESPEQWYFLRQINSFFIENRENVKGKDMKISVLAYHAANIAGNDYHKNDHIALIADLKLFEELEVEIISASLLVDWLDGHIELENKNYVVITFDDGNELDFTDWKHPVYGNQVSFYSALKQSSLNTHATAFVIASSEARKKLEETCLGGNQLLGHKWWVKAEETQLISIENHSWDHVHPTIDTVMQKDNIKENFAKIECFEDADSQIKQSTKYIEEVIPNKVVSLFAYPYGHYNDYLTEEYFPKQQNQIKAAFTCDPEPVTKATNIWKIPRYVCGADWKSVDELRKIIS